MPLYQYQQYVEPPPESVLNPVSWLGQIAQPMARKVRTALLSQAFAFVPVPITSGVLDDKIILGQKYSIGTLVNPSIGGGALFG